MNSSEFFTKEEKDNIVNCIEQAEKNTSGEIRVHIENKCKGDVLDRAAFIFEKLEMHKTQLRNGVLFYLAIADKKIAILGDAGINAKTPDNFWDNIKENMLELFKQEQFSSGLCKGISMAGEQLKYHFPYEKDDINELSNEISFEAK